MNREIGTQLHGYKLILARTAWGIIAAMALVLFIADTPLNYAQYLIVCTQSICQNQLATPDMVRALHSAGLSLQFYALYLTSLPIIIVSIFLAIAVVIAWRKSRDWMALLVSLMLIIVGTGPFTDYQQLVITYPFTQLTGNLLQFLLATLPWLVGYLFPNGHFVPRWTRWLTLLIVFFAGGGILFPASLLNISNWPGPLGPIVQVMIIGTVLFAQIYRYVRVSTPYQRQQTKWVVFGITVVVIYFIMLFIVGTLNPVFTQANSLGSLFAESTYFLAFIIIPLTIAFSILRYRLWDIDLLINRSLVYGILTAILALVYFGCVVLLQHLVNGVTGQAGQSPLVIVASTLAIATLFSPLRRRIQSFIDKRFYRRKYDAAKIIATFSDTLRNEMDLNSLHEHLVAVVEETMQPAHVSLWLRSPAHQQVSWSATPAVPSEDEARGEK